MDQPLFIVSLDFELYWGVCASRTLENYRNNILGVQEAVPLLLELFRKYEIHATWATVGFMFANNIKEIEQFFPNDSLLPTYINPKVNTYRQFDSIEKFEKESNCFFAPLLIRQISDIQGQEIGTHTFSHFFCREAGQTIEQFRADMIAAKNIAFSNGYSVQSVVLPRNQCEPKYIDVLAELGFSSFRDEENDWIHERVRVKPVMRLLRLLDVYFPLTGQGCYTPHKENGIWNFTGSRMYKPYFSKLSILEKQKLRRIKKQMLYAAKNNLAFHLWWHPHNIGIMTDYHLRQLEEVFSYYRELNKQYGMKSLNMNEAKEYMEKNF